MHHTCQQRLANHPCFNVEASASWGRIHLPIAPNCNLQCNFCNRKYDCVNENRPGVTQQVYTPTEAMAVLDQLFQQRSDISVVGIAGPGDPLCEPKNTLATLQAVHERYPDLMLCVSTNGLNLPHNVDALVNAGVTHVTVTVNAVDAAVGKDMYAYIRYNQQVYTGEEAANILIRCQDEGIRGLKEHGLIVKINTVVVPGVNMNHVPAIAKKAAAWGADLMNCMTLIPVADTAFAHLRPPTPEEIHGLREICGAYVPQMRHCGRCRADAVGLLNQTTTTKDITSPS